MQELTKQNDKWNLGIDVAKAKFDVALLLPTGKFKSKVFTNDASGFGKLDAWLTKQSVAGLHACMKATGGVPGGAGRAVSVKQVVASISRGFRFRVVAG